MRTRLSFPQSWRLDINADGEVIAATLRSDEDEGAAVDVEIGALRPWGGDAVTAMRSAMREKLSTADISVLSIDGRRTACGWGYLICEAESLAAVSGRPSRCIIVCYRFLRFIGIVVVAAERDRALARHRNALDHAFDSAIPDWRDSGVPTLWEHWSLVDRDVKHI